MATTENKFGTNSVPWPAVPTLTRDEVYEGVSDAARDYPFWAEDNLHQKYAFDKPENLRKVRVLDLSTGQMNGHFASSQLAEMGADVIQVEPPGGDWTRTLTPFGREEYMFEDNERGEKVGMLFLHEMRNKRSITLNLETEKGRDILRNLVQHADVVIENAPPGDLDAKGIGYRQLSQLNPRLVYAWLGQRGQWGPLKDKPGMLEPVAQAACGFVHGTGQPREFGGRPLRSAMWMCDYVGGTVACHGILTALLYRDTVSGRGQFIESTGAEAIIRILDYSWVWYGMDGSIRPRYGNWDLAINIYSVNPAKDGYMMIGGGHDRLWYRIWGAIGQDRPEIEQLVINDPSLKEVTERLGHSAQVKATTLLSEWLKDKTRDEAEEQLLAEQVASGGINHIDEVAEYPHFKYRGFLNLFNDRLYGDILYSTTPCLETYAPARLKWMGRPAGYDNEEVYLYLLGLNPLELKEMEKEGVI